MPRKESPKRETRKYGSCRFFSSSSSLQRSELQHFEEAMLEGFPFYIYAMLPVLNLRMLNRQTKTDFWKLLSLRMHMQINSTKDVQTVFLSQLCFQHQYQGSVLLLIIKLSGKVPRSTCRNGSTIYFLFPLAAELLPTLLSPSSTCGLSFVYLFQKLQAEYETKTWKVKCTEASRAKKKCEPLKYKGAQYL